NVLVCDLEQPVLFIIPSEELTVGVPQPSVAVAAPSAALIAAAVGLQPGGSGVCVTVITGGVRSAVHVMVLVSVAVLPHASTAVNVLVCDLEQPVLFIIPSEELTVGVPHASVAVAAPSAALIAAAVGLHPGGSGVCVTVMTGGVISSVQVTVLVSVAVFPQASIAVNVLVCDLEQPVLFIIPSEELTVGVPQPS